MSDSDGEPTIENQFPGSLTLTVNCRPQRHGTTVNDSTLGLGGEAGVEASVTLADSIVTYNQETGIDNQRFAAA